MVRARARTRRSTGFGNRPWSEWDVDGRRMELLRAFTFTDPSGTTWTAPSGAVVDGASIPQVFWSILGGPYEGEYRDASIVHDHECFIRLRPWRDVHRMFHQACLAGGVRPLKARLMYAAVYLFGPRWTLTSKRSRLAPLRSYDEAIRVTAWVRANPECTLDSIDAEEARGTPCSVSSRVIAQERATLDKRRVSVIDKRRRIDALLDHRAYP